MKGHHQNFKNDILFGWVYCNEKNEPNRLTANVEYFAYRRMLAIK